VEDQLSCRQITKRLNEAGTPTPTGQNQVWQPATVRNILTNPVYAGTARYNYRQSVLPRRRKRAEAQLGNLKTGHRYRPETEWVLSEAPAIISAELFEKARLQMARNAELARRTYQPSSRRYLLRRLVKCGECGLSLFCAHQKSSCKRYDYLYYDCKGHAPLTCGRTTKCLSRRCRADRLDAVVWQSLGELLHTPAVIARLHEQWAEAKELNLSQVSARRVQIEQRQQRLERQSQKLLDAYQEEIISLSELKTRRQKLTGELQQLGEEIKQLLTKQQQVTHWQEVMGNVETFRQLLGDNLERLSFEERQAVAQCLISKVVVTGEAVDIYYALPFDSPPQGCQSTDDIPEGAPGRFYRLRLAHLNREAAAVVLKDPAQAQASQPIDRVGEVAHLAAA
jgi:site-specific DNA recombinase